MAKRGVNTIAAQDAEWRAESDLRTLMEAKVIENDPKRCKAAKDLAKKKMLEVASVAAEGKDES